MSNQTKNSASWTNPEKGHDKTWDEADFSWDNAEGTWESNQDVYTNQSRNSASYNNQTKN